MPADKQLELFQVEAQIEFEDIELGVLENGTPYISETGLSKMLGIDRKTIYEISVDWANQKLKPRGKAINYLLKQSDYHEDDLFVKAVFNGKNINAYTEPVCMAFLEYYAFEANEPKEQSIRAFRRLAKGGLRAFVYSAVGYKPEQKILESWKHFHDRTDLTIDACPVGFFGVFREIGIMIVPMIRAGIIISDKVVPDISVGKAWSLYWTANSLEKKFGDRAKYEHEYLDYYPQAKSNPQPSYCYPNEALGHFRNWLIENYIVTKLPKYLLNQTNKGKLPIELAQEISQVFKLGDLRNKKLN